MIVFTKQTEDLWKTNNGNFGLWFYKYVPVTNEMEPCDAKENHEGATVFYVTQYQGRTKDNKTIQALLNEKREQQERFISSMQDTYSIQSYSITLQTPLVIGMGESHPSENGITLDHNLGIPYIPASSIKGALRHAYTVCLIEQLEREGRLDEFVRKGRGGDYLVEAKTRIPSLFGGETTTEYDENKSTSGDIVLLDAYPENIPTLQSDIMNNHYSEYYNNSEQVPPSDTETPKPVSFLSVKPSIKYTFYILIRKSDHGAANDHPTKDINEAAKRMFQNGLGAKTATGYGRFDWEKYETDRIAKMREEEEQSRKLLQEEARKKAIEKERIEEAEREAELKRKKERARQEEEQRHLENEAKKNALKEERRGNALARGIEGFREATYFNALSDIAYITDDHPLGDSELRIMKEIIANIYSKEKKSKEKAKKWKKRNEGNWKKIGTWVGGELKNRWFKELTGQ